MAQLGYQCQQIYHRKTKRINDVKTALDLETPVTP